MLATTISTENAAAFVHLIAPEITARLYDDGVLAIGTISEEDGLELASGALVFSIDEGESDGEPFTAAVIKWLFVDEHFRGRGVADRLMGEFIRVAGVAGVDHVICDLPMPAEYNGLCGYHKALQPQKAASEKGAEQKEAPKKSKKKSSEMEL